jgi:DNA-binding NtrC family response regulator
MRAVFALLERVADSESTLLFEGESGTGKDVAARSVHAQSTRKGGLFIAVDCGAIPRDLVESELFGHAKGAFTGAVDERMGPFEMAKGGTVFLDEVGELPLDLQPKLLRALEMKTIRRVGETKTRPIDARVLAATNRNLSREVEAGNFREDLYFRIAVIRVRMPPLRERREEIPRLIAHFLKTYGRDPTEPLPEPLLAALTHHRWPGNVRELRNVIERIALVPGMTADFYIDRARGESPGEHKPVDVQVSTDVAFHEGKRRIIDDFERKYFAEMLKRCNGNISEVARVSGLSRQSCHRLLNRHSLA